MGVFYPELDYDEESKSRIFSDLMNYSWKKNDYNTGTQLKCYQLGKPLSSPIF